MAGRNRGFKSNQKNNNKKGGSFQRTASREKVDTLNFLSLARSQRFINLIGSSFFLPSAPPLSVKSIIKKQVYSKHRGKKNFIIFSPEGNLLFSYLTLLVLQDYKIILLDFLINSQRKRTYSAIEHQETLWIEES
ncbi:MAG: hypothetical protein A2173_06245 [Planctomycetes bacterium RBG_13_44_8b]|nr:MAG: hypothetical protein A2173_06245 [Planctomycetes bacterium RBG_13_44_8b]